MQRLARWLERRYGRRGALYIARCVEAVGWLLVAASAGAMAVGAWVQHLQLVQ